MEVILPVPLLTSLFSSTSFFSPSFNAWFFLEFLFFFLPPPLLLNDAEAR